MGSKGDQSKLPTSSICPAMLYIVHVYNAVNEIACYFVSYPGDPIPNQQSRIGAWPDKDIDAPLGWMVAVDKESHDVTNARHPKYHLTGESCGRQIWFQSDDVLAVFEKGQLKFNPAKNPNAGDKIFRAIMLRKWKGPRPDTSLIPTTAKEAVSKAISFYQMIQTEDGHWAGDYGGPMFLMPGLICVLFLTGVPFPPGRKEAMITYMRNHQQLDGGWGTHIECASTMFGTVLQYVSLRLLGEPADAPNMIKAREFIHNHGGALYAPSWAKFWMAVIGVFDWDGINSIPVEMWLLPRWFPLHPGKMWCHARMVYLPMGYVYCKRYQPDVSKFPVLQELRKELYLENYDRIDWNSYRQTCAEIDEYSPLNPLMKVAQDALSIYERYLRNLPMCKYLREKALDFSIEYIRAEDLQTNYIDIGPVNKALNMLSVFIASNGDTTTEEFQRHLARVDDYLWVAEDGMKMQGYNGSQCWDTSFATQAIIESGVAEQFPGLITKTYSYFDRTQIKNDEENREYFFRHISKGGWPFSTAAHGWPITDCASEGLKGVLAIHANPKLRALIPPGELIAEERLRDTINILLSYQNEDGGWATYENNRGYGWYELFNPSEVFGDIMIDYSYVECSSACITAMKAYINQHTDYRYDEVKASIVRGREFLKSIQRKDGSWYGSWGNCFTYGTWFGVEGLVAAGESKDSFAIRRAVQFLLARQNANGGWGESYLACVNKAYPAEGSGAQLGTEGSGVVQTAWAMLALMAADPKDNYKAEVTRGKDFLLSKQLPDGDWDQEGITGVFNRSCGITYTAYRNIFPIWALGRFSTHYE
eukprot:scaffold572_cov163-Ochromonas_danica.AAC.4